MAYCVGWRKQDQKEQELGEQMSRWDDQTVTPVMSLRRNYSMFQASQVVRFDPWVGKIPLRRAWKPTLVLMPGESMDRES